MRIEVSSYPKNTLSKRGMDEWGVKIAFFHKVIWIIYCMPRRDHVPSGREMLPSLLYPFSVLYIIFAKPKCIVGMVTHAKSLPFIVILLLRLYMSRLIAN